MKKNDLKEVSYAKYGYMFIAPFFIAFLIFQFIPLIQDRIVCVSRDPLPGATERFVPVEALRGQKVVLLYGGDEMDVEA